MTLLLVVGGLVLLALVENLVPLRAATGGKQRTRTNLLLTAITIAMTVTLGVGGAALSVALRNRSIGLLAGNETSIAMLAVGIVSLDFVTWAAHALMHRIPWLWRFHRVDHADAHIDVTTSFRHHPFETVFRVACLVAAGCALGIPPEVVATYRLISAVNGLFEHANIRVWRPLDRATLREM